MSELLNDYHTRMSIPVVWGDMDSFQHVNNLVYLGYFESIRMLYMDRCNYSDVMKETGIGPILKSTDCTYRIPLTYPDTVIAAVRVTEVKEDRFVMEHVVYSEQHQKIAAEGHGIIVCVDYQRNCKAPIPERMREMIREIDGI
ncbi:thioesterase family protein [Motiliproteus sp. MSK22-1]|uniref:acyl-CoA thioesterase n=1 Tax=Motiliproteus sp. MSK22-1 TaxID=1897630 RepID=UPI000975B2C6|nr:acyl-CoA thioesterase [Motiliproteus sp. MSK22-1]OMH29044.1 thioesterase [Motiliproteus sp. MSK22-1]